MLAKVAQVMEIIEALAPRSLAEEWDNPGLQVGDPAAEATSVLVALDLTDAVLEEAAAVGAKLVVCHHPAILKPLPGIRLDLPVGRRLARALAAGIAVYAAHTNLDAAPGGLNDILARKLGLEDLRILRPTREEKLFKLVVFVPRGHEDAVRDALAGAGAGWIGNYSHCTFQAAGTGTFKPGEGTHPFLGRQGEVERADEYRLETIVPEPLLRASLRAMIKAHPYEEVAYDVYPLANQGRESGLGRVGRLKEAVSLAGLAARVKERLGLAAVRAVGEPSRVVHQAAVCGGSGGSLVGVAAFAGADVLITGDVRYHDALEALERGLGVIDAGHFGTEAAALDELCGYLNDRLAAVPCETRAAVSRAETDPFREG